MKRILLLSILVLSSGSPGIAGQTQPAANDDAGVRAAAAAYCAAYNRGDAKAVAQFWSDKGEWISPSGQRVQGRAAIQKELESLFAENKGQRLEVVVSSVRFIHPQVAVEEGRVHVTQPGQPASESTYIAIEVKQADGWKLDSVRETEVPAVTTTASPLSELEWLVGEWTDPSGDSAVSSKTTWTKNKAFLTNSFTASVPGMDDLAGTVVIGWDPAEKMVRSWMFDSDGGFGEGTWSKKDNHWIVKFKQTLPDGRKASATNIYTQLGDGTFTWQSIGREVDGQYLPNVGPVKLVRKTAEGTKFEQPLQQGAEK